MTKGTSLGTPLRNPQAVPAPPAGPPGSDQIYKVAVGDAPETAQVIRDDQAQAAKLGANGTPHFFIDGARVSGAMPYESFKAVIDAQLKRANAVLASGVQKKELYESLIKDGQSGPPAPPPQAAPSPQARNVDPGDGPWTGAKRPKVTIVEWSDFQCPYCARVEPTLKQILEAYKEDVG